MADSTPTNSPLVILAALVVASSVLVATTWHVFGHTWDEPEHLASGLELIDHGQYIYDLQHPPLARVLIALGPYLAGARSRGHPPPDGQPEGLAILYDSGHYDLFLTLARLGALPFLSLLMLATWLWARRLLPPAFALIAVIFVATTPPILGHAGLAALDVPAAATCVLAFYALQRWIELNTRVSAACCGLAVGVAVATKLSAMAFVALAAVGLGLIHAWRQPPGARLKPAPGRCGGTLLAIVLVCAVITLAYGGRFIYYTDSTHRYNHALQFLFGKSGLVHDLAYGIAAHVPLPEGFGLVVGGVQALEVHNALGHPSYLLGEVRSSGWWYFYVVALATKMPLPLLGLGLAGLARQVIEGARRRDAWLIAPTLLVILVLAFCSGYSRINLGVRHVLVIVPLLALGAAYAVMHMWRSAKTLSPGPRRGLARVAVILLLAWQVSVLPRAYPDYLAYFNETVAHPEHVLVDSDLDWGQDLKRLERRLAARQVPQLALAYAGSADLAREPLPAVTPLLPGKPVAGWVAITALARSRDEAGYAWLNTQRPVEHIGKTIDLYLIDSADAARLATQVMSPPKS
jgi:4-amino-4-deoxy-L-arabinose transferase-like glycosyltransferase